MAMRLSKITKDILRLASTGALLYVVYGSPSSARKMNNIIAKQLSSKVRHYYKQRIHLLEQRGLIYLGGEKIVLTAAGKKLLQIVQNEEIQIERKKWDRTWRLVSYDIPNSHKQKRDAFRRRIEKLGFEQIQKSLFAFPYECKEVIAVLAQQYKVAPYVIYMQTQHLPMEQRLRKYFDLIPIK